MLKIARLLERPLKELHSGKNPLPPKREPRDLKKGGKPPKKTKWAIDEDDGPMWTRAFKARRRKPKDAPSKKSIRAILDRLGAERIVLGHAPTRDGSIVTDHPHYGESVILIDTRISDDERGKLSALVLQHGGIRTAYAGDRADGDALFERETRAVERPAGFMGRIAAAIGWLFGRRD